MFTLEMCLIKSIQYNYSQQKGGNLRKKKYVHDVPTLNIYFVQREPVNGD